MMNASDSSGVCFYVCHPITHIVVRAWMEWVKAIIAVDLILNTSIYQFYYIYFRFSKNWTMCAAISAQEKLQAAMQNKIVPNQVGVTRHGCAGVHQGRGDQACSVMEHICQWGFLENYQV